MHLPTATVMEYAISLHLLDIAWNEIAIVDQFSGQASTV